MTKLHDCLDKVKRLDKLIRRQGTGTPKEFAKKLKVSEATLYNYLDFLKDMGASIQYCPHRCSYYYKGGGGFNIRFEFQQEPKEGH
ncbi:MAG: helix-turn-helix domain-containing protein [Bacteroidetes bacterium]|nr:MAG: helix-turn-helix domain-containing protein [Bacteroidota bacterium]